MVWGLSIFKVEKKGVCKGCALGNPLNTSRIYSNYNFFITKICIIILEKEINCVRIYSNYNFLIILENEI